MKDIKLFIFDMDGVLTETSEQHYQAWKEMASGVGIEIDREFNEKLKGISRVESLERILQHGGKEGMFSQEQKDELAFNKNENYKTMIQNFTPENLFPGVKELFEDLKNRGIKIAIGSASKNAPALISNMGIEGYIDYIVNPNDIENGKPAPDIFLKAAKELGVDPSKCMGVEDAEAGVEAIKSAGMYAIGIGEAHILCKADIVYAETKDVNLEDLLG